MISIGADALTAQDHYRILTGSIIPRPVAFVTSRSESNVLNGAPFSYFNIISADPPLISISVQRTNGRMKDTARNAVLSKEFVVHIVDEDNVAKINETAASLPPDESEIELAELTTIDSHKVSVPGVAEAKVRFECVLEKVLPLGGTEEEPSTDLLIGRIIHYHFEEGIYQNGRIDAAKLQPVSRLAGSIYSKLGELFKLKRPK